MVVLSYPQFIAIVPTFIKKFRFVYLDYHLKCIHKRLITIENCFAT